MSVELYEKYTAALEAARWDCEFVECDWNPLPRRLHATWLPYGMMLSEFSREIANSLNDLINYTRRLRAWSAVVAPMSDQEKLDTVHEFIDPVAIVSLNLPAVIRARFAFAAAHLCHQANRALDGADWKEAVSYAFGALPALALDDVADLLAVQCNRGRLAFEAFQGLVREHERSIAE